MLFRSEAPTALGWREHPSTYVLTARDLVFSPELQRRMAAHATRTTEVDAGHIPLLSRPAELAQAIAEAALRPEAGGAIGDVRTG